MIARIQYITGELPYDQILYHVRDFCRAGGQWVQLRIKGVNPGKFLEIAQKTKRICNQYNTKLIINDDPHIARAVNAHGVHLGKSDMSPSDARILLFPHQIIGSTCNSICDIERVMKEGKSTYIGLGPIFKTVTKKNAEPELGIDQLYDIIHWQKKHKIDIPIIAIGGISINTAEQVLECGAHGIAFSSMFEKAVDKVKIIKQIQQIIEHEGAQSEIEIRG